MRCLLARPTAHMASEQRDRSALLAHQPEVVFSVLIEVFCLDGLPPARRVLCEVGVQLVVAPSVGQGSARIAGRMNALRTWARWRLLLAWRALRPERSSARTLVQGSLRS